MQGERTPETRQPAVPREGVSRSAQLPTFLGNLLAAGTGLLLLAYGALVLVLARADWLQTFRERLGQSDVVAVLTQVALLVPLVGLSTAAIFALSWLIRRKISVRLGLGWIAAFIASACTWPLTCLHFLLERLAGGGWPPR